MSFFRTLTDKPWKSNPYTATGIAADAVIATTPPQAIALRFFLGVVSVMFGLFIVAYFIRMELADWRPMPESTLLWVNTLLLFLSSLVLQWTRNAVQGETDNRFRTGMIIGGLLTLGFVYGQLTVWQQMAASGFTVNSNPANSFFYILTGIHGLHILGGLLVWAWAAVKAWSGEADKVRLSIELCAIYWHFLLLVWLALFALISYT